MFLILKWDLNNDHIRRDSSNNLKTVYISNYRKAEMNNYMNDTVNGYKAFGKFYHERSVTPIESPQSYQVPRMNRDTFYSYAVFDLTKPVTFELPPTNGIYMSLYAFDEEQYSLATVYTDTTKNVKVTFTYSDSYSRNFENKYNIKVNVITKYMYVMLRTLVDPNDSVDVNRAHGLQDIANITQANKGEFIIPNWDKNSLVQCRRAISPLGVYTEPGISMNGYRGEIDPTYQLIGTAGGPGGLPQEDAAYQVFFPKQYEIETKVYKITVPAGEPPIDKNAFWSISVYNSTGYFEYNEWDSYSLNSLTADQETDGSYIIYFSSSENKKENMKNWLYTFPKWNYMVRLYQPDAEIINYEYLFPQLEEVE